MSCTKLYVDPTKTLRERPSKEKDPSEERPKMSVSFSGSCSPKLALYIATGQLAHSRLIARGDCSLGGQEP